MMLLFQYVQMPDASDACSHLLRPVSKRSQYATVSQQHLAVFPTSGPANRHLQNRKRRRGTHTHARARTHTHTDPK